MQILIYCPGKFREDYREQWKDKVNRAYIVRLLDCLFEVSYPSPLVSCMFCPPTSICLKNKSCFLSGTSVSGLGK